VRSLLLLGLVACAPVRPPAVSAPRDATRYYTIWLGGARVGTAIERETWTAAGMHLQRDEQLRFARGDAEVELATTIDIDADAALAARKVRWVERAGAQTRAAEAVRDHDGWSVSTGAHLAAAAVPAELVPLIVRRDGAFAGAVFLPARGFVAGTGRIEPVAPGRLVARLELEGTRVEATIDLDGEGLAARVVDGEGVIAIRASETQAHAAFPIADLIAATALPLTGQRAHRVVLDGELALPPLPGQAARPTAAGVEVELSPALPGALPAGPPGRDRRADITALVAAVRGRITPDLGAPPARDPLHATAGDCTTFALAYAALAAHRGIPTRVVTGLRIDGERLVRHRWAVSWTGRAWIAVDAAFGAAPAGGDLIGLALHDADDAGLVAGEAALTRVHAASWAR
jgi:hypothetical protein